MAQLGRLLGGVVPAKARTGRRGPPLRPRGGLNAGCCRSTRALPLTKKGGELVLTETARSVGCEFQAKQFERAGYTVTFPWPPQGTRKRGVMIVSRLATSPLRLAVGPPSAPGGHRDRGDRHGAPGGPRGVRAVPRADGGEGLQEAHVPGGPGRRAPHRGGGHRLVLGDFNILEPEHVPEYRTFQVWEYAFPTTPASPGPSHAT